MSSGVNAQELRIRASFDDDMAGLTSRTAARKLAFFALTLISEVALRSSPSVTDALHRQVSSGFWAGRRPSSEAQVS